MARLQRSVVNKMMSVMYRLILSGLSNSKKTKIIHRCLSCTRFYKNVKFVQFIISRLREEIKTGLQFSFDFILVTLRPLPVTDTSNKSFCMRNFKMLAPLITVQWLKINNKRPV